MILRHIETDSIDYDTMLYCYLKVGDAFYESFFFYYIIAGSPMP